MRTEEKVIATLRGLPPDRQAEVLDFAEFLKALTQSVVSSGQALASGQAELPVEKPKDFISLAVDTV